MAKDGHDGESVRRLLCPEHTVAEHYFTEVQRLCIPSGASRWAYGAHICVQRPFGSPVPLQHVPKQLEVLASKGRFHWEHLTARPSVCSPHFSWPSYLKRHSSLLSSGQKLARQMPGEEKVVGATPTSSPCSLALLTRISFRAANAGATIQSPRGTGVWCFCSPIRRRELKTAASVESSDVERGSEETERRFAKMLVSLLDR